MSCACLGLAIFVLCLCAAAILLWARNHRNGKLSSTAGVPGPQWLCGFGGVMTYFRFLWMGVPEAATFYSERYGDFVRVWIAGTPTYLIARTSASGHVLKSNGSNYTQRFGDVTGLTHIGMYENGIIWNHDVTKWKLLRSLFQKALNADTLAQAVPISVTSTERLIRVLPELQRRTADSRVETLDFLRRITLTIVNNLTLDVTIDDDEELVSSIVAYFKAWEYFLIKPSWLYSLCPGYKHHVTAVAVLNKHIEKLLTLKRQKMGRDGIQDELDVGSHDFTECLIRAEMKGKVEHSDVRQCVLEMILAGTDTSSVTMYYLLVAMADSPDVESKIMDELHDVLGDRAVTRTDLSKLVYLEMALKESMRVKPVGPVIMRRALRDDVIDGYPTPGGTQIVLNLAQMHRREEVFERPDQFDPERYAVKDLQNDYMPFGSGPKGCVGQYLAMVEMKCVLATLLRHYRLLSCGQTLTTLHTCWDIAQQPSAPSYMYFVPRETTVK